MHFFLLCSNYCVFIAQEVWPDGAAGWMEGHAGLHYKYVSENNHVEKQKFTPKLGPVPSIDVCHGQTSGQMEAITYTRPPLQEDMICGESMQKLNVD